MSLSAYELTRIYFNKLYAVSCKWFAECYTFFEVKNQRKIMTPAEKKADLKRKYEALGAQKSTLQEYIARQEKTKKKTFKLPPAVKYILMAPFLLFFAFGILFLPFMLYKAFTAPATSTASK